MGEGEKGGKDLWEGGFFVGFLWVVEGMMEFYDKVNLEFLVGRG